MSFQVCVIIPESLRNRAKDYRINVSEVCRKALAIEVEKVEKEAGVSPSKANPQHANIQSNPNSGGCDE